MEVTPILPDPDASVADVGSAPDVATMNLSAGEHYMQVSTSLGHSTLF